MKKPQTLKLVIKGMTASKLEYQMEDGTVITYEEYQRSLVPSKKNQQRIAVNKTTGKGFLLPSKQYIDWMEKNQRVFNDWNVKLYDMRVSLPIIRCKIKVLFYFPDAKDRDLDNKFLTISDCMVAADIIPKDSFKIYNKLALEGYINRERPRTEVYITILTPKDREYEIDQTPASYYDKQKQRKNLLRKIQRDKKKQGVKYE